jgi:hypothetical protein
VCGLEECRDTNMDTIELHKIGVELCPHVDISPKTVNSTVPKFADVFRN